jgi:2-(1,2-epoxy-1,2-dihydrophenyl)acetyl-CoA isomerase
MAAGAGYIMVSVRPTGNCRRELKTDGSTVALPEVRQGSESPNQDPMETILTNVTEGVMTITLHRPDVLNSMNAAMADALLAALTRAASDSSVRALLLTGAGRAFCAGQDLAEVLPVAGAAMPDLGEVVARQYNPVIRAIRTLEKPVVCSVNGVAAGAGANMAFACDITLAAEEATFIQSFSKIGLIPDSGGTYLLPRLIGLQRAAALTMLGDKLPAAKAKEWGLVFDTVPGPALFDVAMGYAKRLAAMPTRGLGLTKRGFNAGLSNDLDAQLALEEGLQREAGSTKDYAEGVRAFVEKRKPVFHGH